jgi:alanyl-tRNA synthetase
MSLQDFSTDSLRQSFINYFEARGHKVIPSSSLVPVDDTTVLFTTAGMQQFKLYYSFPDESPNSRIATVQKCLRTGDIDQVGDETHLTFFEMMGNFSFGYPKKEGSYFKEEAIKMAWEYLTDNLGIEKNRISATYFAGDKGIVADDESKDLIKKITRLDDSKILGTGFNETFWSLGTEGSPGGPTVEFYVDGVEIWNLVFNEYVMKGGEYVGLDQKGVDTGMGFERLVAVVQAKNNVYETDLFQPIIKKLEKISGRAYEENEKEFRIIADHLRAAEALILDGVIPSNKDRGYVLRRLIRRSIVKARQLGINENLYSRVVAGKAKTELEKEELKFRKTLESFLKDIEVLSALRIKNNNENYKKTTISAKTLFDWYQSDGVPLEIALEEAEKRNIKIESGAIDSFNVMKENHKKLSRTASAGMFKGGLQTGGEMETKYHTATHLLLAALRKVLGPEIYQKGSNINSERLRFDFSYPEKLTDGQIGRVEDLVNQKISENISVQVEEMPKEKALKAVKVSFDPSKYPNMVKVYSIGNFSREVCGGPHVKNTGELGHFEIVKEESSSSGIRRIKAILK